MSAWKMTGLTDAGRVREHNEDAIAWDTEQGWAVLADGMGGHNAGEVASAIAVEVISEQFNTTGTAEPAAILQAAVEQANSAIYQQATSQPRLHTMGTTVVAIRLDGQTLHCAHVGDSRLYRLRGGELQQLTRDHSLVQELVDEGMINAEQARSSKQKNVITRALGLEMGIEVEMSADTMCSEDCYLLCSDGLSDRLRDEEIAALLAGEALPEVARSLIDAANECGGEDNISVIVFQVWE
ncbi:MAG: Stp1/IreP family PP2C-type Ser/Thr phosphatase [Pseudomonadota bacterium]